MIVWLGGPQSWVGPRHGVDVLKKTKIFFLAGNRTLKDTYHSFVTARTGLDFKC